MIASEEEFNRVLFDTKILKSPKHDLVTFGTNNIYYYLLTEPFTSKIIVRVGRVISERPQIISLRRPEDIFEGFGETNPYFEMLLKKYDLDIKALQYKFKNQFERLFSADGTLENMIIRIGEEIEKMDLEPVTIIKGVEKGWQLGLMKFAVEMVFRSFHSNIAELSERGLFR